MLTKLRAGLYQGVLVGKDGTSHLFTVEHLTPDVSSEKGWAFAIDNSELSEPYLTKREAKDGARATFFGYHASNATITDGVENENHQMDKKSSDAAPAAPLRAWCGGTAFHPEHNSVNGGWCPGLLNPSLVTYELRPDKWYAERGYPVITLQEGTDDLRFPQAVEIADNMPSSPSIWRIAPSLQPDGGQRIEEHYIVDAGNYWRDPAEPEGHAHQIGSKGACWDCYKETGQPVRHPVTPGEVLTGELLPCRMPDDDPCPACGGGYRFWVLGELPTGYDYVKHREDCEIMAGLKITEDYLPEGK